MTPSLPHHADEPAREREQREKSALSIQAAAVAAQQSALMLEEGRLLDRKRELELQERQLAEHFQAERQSLVAGEEALDKQREALDQKEHQLLAEAGPFDEAKERLAEEKQAFEASQRKVIGEIEVRRRQLAVQLAKVQADREKQRRTAFLEERRLEELRRDLVEREEQLREQSLEWERTQSRAATDTRTGIQELNRLDNRIRQARRLLGELQSETESAERSLFVQRERRAPLATAEQGPAASAELNVIELVALALMDLEDESRRVVRQEQRLREVNAEWQSTWRSLVEVMEARVADLDGREEILLPRELELAGAEHVLRQRVLEIEQHRRHLGAWEARLTERQASFEHERRRVSQHVKSQREAARRTRRMFRKLVRQWREERAYELAAYAQKHRDCEQVRQEYAELRERLQEREARGDARERQLLEQELVVLQVRQELVARESDPAAAERELERRKRRWEKLALAPLRTAKVQQAEADEHARWLNALHEQLVEKHLSVEQREADCARRETDQRKLEAEHQAERLRWKATLEALKGDNRGLEEHVKELRQQLERLAGTLIAEAPGHAPALAA